METEKEKLIAQADENKENLEDRFLELEKIDEETIDLDTYFFAGGLFFFIGYRLPRILLFTIGSPVFFFMAFFKTAYVWRMFKSFWLALTTALIFLVLCFPPIFVVLTQALLVTRNLENASKKQLSSEWKFFKALMILMLAIIVAKETTQGLKNVFYYIFVFIKKIYTLHRAEEKEWNMYRNIQYGFGYFVAIIPGLLQIIVSIYIFYGCLFLLGNQTDIYFVTIGFAGLVVILSFDNFVWSFVKMLNLHWLFAKLCTALSDDDDIMDEVLYETTKVVIAGSASFKIRDFPAAVRVIYHFLNLILILGLLIYGEHFVSEKL